MKKQISLLLILSVFVLGLNAQTDAKYLKGAVVEENGKVIFSKTITPNDKLSDSELFNKLDVWAKANYNGDKPENRILLNDADKKQIACSGVKELVFGRKLLALDVAPMTYQLIIGVEDGKCDLKVRGIYYDSLLTD